MPTELIDPRLVASVVAGATGRHPTTVRRVPGSVANQDFVVELSDATRVVLKTGPATEIAAEAWACRRLTELGIPVPAVLAVADDAGLGRPSLLLTFVAGGPSEDPAVAREAGRWFRGVHAVELPGWGPVIPGLGGSARGPYDTPREAIAAELSGVPELVAAGVLDGRLADTATALVTVADILGGVDQGVLLHHDLKPAHLFGRTADGGSRLSAVIDWGDASVGDPLADVARLSMSGPSLTAAFLDGYGLALTAALTDRLARHRIRWNLRALAYEHRAGGDWFDVYRDRVRADVALLTG